MCYKLIEVPLEVHDYSLFKLSGKAVQDYFPDLEPKWREMLTAGRTCPDCYDKLCGRTTAPECPTGLGLVGKGRIDTLIESLAVLGRKDLEEPMDGDDVDDYVEYIRHMLNEHEGNT